MVRVTLQQNRTGAIITGAGLAIRSALLVVLGTTMSVDFQTSGLSACVAHSVSSAACTVSGQAFFGRYVDLTDQLQRLLSAMPVLAGVFVGAPLIAGELEHGTHVLAWTQSVTRTRWIVITLSLVIGAAVVVSAIATLVISWAWHPLNEFFGNSFRAFDIQGLVPVAYTLFAVALGVAAGTVLSRTVPAMAVTLLAFIGVRFLLEDGLRPQILTPNQIIWDPAGAYPRQGMGDWILPTPPGQYAHQIVDSAGNVLTPGQEQALLLQAGGPNGQYLHEHGYRYLDFYQPVGHFWALQGIESAIFAGLAIGLVAVSLWWIRHRISS